MLSSRAATRGGVLVGLVPQYKAPRPKKYKAPRPAGLNLASERYWNYDRFQKQIKLQRTLYPKQHKGGSETTFPVITGNRNVKGTLDKNQSSATTFDLYLSKLFEHSKVRVALSIELQFIF